MAKESIGGMNRAELEFFGMLPMLDIVFPALDRLHEEQLKNGLLK